METKLFKEFKTKLINVDKEINNIEREIAILNGKKEMLKDKKHIIAKIIIAMDK